MKQIAKELGISRTSVSAVLNNKGIPKVSEETMRKIRAIAEREHYRPNRMAQLLCGKPAKIIGMVRCGYAPALYAEISDMIAKAVAKHGYSVYYSLVHEPGRERDVIEELASKGADGFIVFHNKGEIKHESFTCPIVLCSAQSCDFDLTIDLKRGGAMAAKHFMSHGYRNLAFIAPDRGVANENKFSGLRSEALANGLPEPMFFCSKEHGSECDNKIVELIRDGEIRAGLCSNDLVAGYLVQMLQSRGVRVPDDFAVIGFDGMSFSEFMKPSLSTIIQPIREIADAAVEILLRKIETKELKRTACPKNLEPFLHVGESCGCERGSAPAFNRESYLITLPDAEKEGAGK